MKFNKLGQPRFGLNKGERQEYINSSLISSASFLDRLSYWEHSDDPERLVVLRFEPEWSEEQGPVMFWHSQQSETRFTSIEHRKDQYGPFYHEFLLLKLLDGSVCRVERMGLGSRFDAIRLIGCSAKDLIQRFTPAAYEIFSKAHPSTLIAEICFKKEFDIMDVLAICYSIQRVESCRVYTLQRYNCYFLCWTVMTILARRVANWESQISDKIWDMEIDTQLASLANLSLEKSKDDVLVQLFTLLNSDNPRPVGFIFDSLHWYLSSRYGTLQNFSLALAATLWTDSHQRALEHGIARALKDAVVYLLGSEFPRMAQIKAAMGVKDWPEIAIHRNDLMGRIQRQLMTQAGRFQAQRAKIHSTLLKMNALEKPICYPRMKTYQVCCGVAAAVFMLLPLRASICILNAFPSTADSKDTDVDGEADLSARAAWLNESRSGEESKDQFNAAFDICHHRYFGPMVAETLNTLGAQGLLDAIGIDSLITTAVPIIPVQLGFRTLITATLAPQLVNVIQPGGPCLRLRCKVDGLGMRNQDLNTAEEMQKHYIHALIDTHAHRVASHRLAAAPLVVDAIKNTMTEVWRALPPGYGAVKSMNQYELYPEGISYFSPVNCSPDVKGN
ncbi:hypothetical protein RhiJN_24030 [Ceratobasidium sp. AG-Ba]|nr:hypothetical protein RhiJN_24030 [Ceratobasidium sp. AG-Ba]